MVQQSLEKALENKEEVKALLALIENEVQTKLGLATPSSDLVLTIAKDLGLVEGKRGRFGGTFLTEKGKEKLKG